jgi:hypothetical protein
LGPPQNLGSDSKPFEMTAKGFGMKARTLEMAPKGVETNA